MKTLAIVLFSLAAFGTSLSLASSPVDAQPIPLSDKAN